jgi:hypothetical protein
MNKQRKDRDSGGVVGRSNISFVLAAGLLLPSGESGGLSIDFSHSSRLVPSESRIRVIKSAGILKCK